MTKDHRTYYKRHTSSVRQQSTIIKLLRKLHRISCTGCVRMFTVSNFVISYGFIEFILTELKTP